jgi:epoxide hydrolase-like predicted phosphatase
MGILDRILRAGEGKKLKALEGLVPDINALASSMSALSDDALQGKTNEFRQRIERGEITFADAQALNIAAFKEAGIEMPARPPIDPNRKPDAAPAMTFQPNVGMMDLVDRLRTAGLKVGILTNNIREFRDLWRTLMPYEELFDDIVDSHEVGLRKPNPAIYELALTRLNATPGRSAFLDDVDTNVAAAERVGMFGILVEEDSAPAIAATERLAGLI